MPLPQRRHQRGHQQGAHGALPRSGTAGGGLRDGSLLDRAAAWARSVESGAQQSARNALSIAVRGGVGHRELSETGIACAKTTTRAARRAGRGARRGRRLGIGWHPTWADGSPSAIPSPGSTVVTGTEGDLARGPERRHRGLRPGLPAGAMRQSDPGRRGGTRGAHGRRARGPQRHRRVTGRHRHVRQPQCGAGRGAAISPAVSCEKIAIARISSGLANLEWADGPLPSAERATAP